MTNYRSYRCPHKWTLLLPTDLRSASIMSTGRNLSWQHAQMKTQLGYFSQNLTSRGSWKQSTTSVHCRARLLAWAKQTRSVSTLRRAVFDQKEDVGSNPGCR